jgi:hypothetical protein
MDVEKILKKLKRKKDDLTISQYNEIVMFSQCITKNNDKISDSYIVRTLSRQLDLNLTNLYEKYVTYIKTIKPKDSTSLHSFVVRFGEQGKAMYDERIKSCPPKLSSYIEKYGEDEGKKAFDQYKKSKSMSLDNCIRRYGLELGTIKYKEYWENTSFGMSKEKFKKRFGLEWENEYNKFVDACKGRKNQLIEKYGEIVGNEIWNDIQNKKALSCSKDVFTTKLTDQGYSIEEIADLVNNRWNTLSKESFIRRYGNDDGVIKYDEFCMNNRKNNRLCREYYDNMSLSDDEITSKILDEQKRMNSNIKKSSKAAYNLLRPIANKFIETGLCDSYNLDDEFRIDLSKYENEISGNHFYYYDLTFTDLNLIIEYHGKMYHEDVDYLSTTNLSYEYFENNFNKDLFKKFVAERRGFTVIVVREWLLKTDKLELFKFIKNTYNIEENQWVHLFV